MTRWMCVGAGLAITSPKSVSARAAPSRCGAGWRQQWRKGQACSCHEPLPVLDWYTFTFSSGQVACFRLGQCRRCRAIYWEED